MAFNVPPWRADGLEYLDPASLSFCRRWAQRSQVVRRHPVWRFGTRLYWARLIDERRLACSRLAGQ
jgi:hypothetical protein